MISIVIPVLNEERSLPATLDAIAKLHGDCEVLVVDGGSTDRTTDIAEARGVRVLRSARGRGHQLHTGANASRGDVFWFLHADTLPPVDALTRIRAALADPAVSGGYFAPKFDGDRRAAHWLTRVYPHLGKLGLCYGDSGIFVRRTVYERVGGFQPFPIFEDLDLLKRMKHRGRLMRLKEELVTSSRRFEGRSFTLTFARWTAMQVLFWAGVHPRTLGRWYAPIRGKS